MPGGPCLLLGTHWVLRACVCVQSAVDRMLVVHAASASAEARQQHLKLLVEVYKRTHALAEQLQVPPHSAPTISCASTSIRKGLPSGIYGIVCSARGAVSPFNTPPRIPALHLTAALVGTVTFISVIREALPVTQALCSRSRQELVGDGTDVMEMSEGVFAEALSDYPGMELAWLQLLYDKAMQQAQANPTPLSMPAVLLPALSGFRSKVRPVIARCKPALLLITVEKRFPMEQSQPAAPPLLAMYHGELARRL